MVVPRKKGLEMKWAVYDDRFYEIKESFLAVRSKPEWDPRELEMGRDIIILLQTVRVSPIGRFHSTYGVPSLHAITSTRTTDRITRISIQSNWLERSENMIYNGSH